MRLIPVIDVLNGIVVHGVAGRRENYRPLQSALTKSTAPLDVARAIRDRWGTSTLYVADLDAITRRKPNEGLIADLTGSGFEVWIDSGLRQPQDVTAQILTANGQLTSATRVIVGLETWHSPHTLSELVALHGPDRIVFSLDLKQGAPLADPATWGTQPVEIAALAVAAGVQSLIVLDLAGVGVSQGVPSRELCRHLRALFPTLELITGGGVRGLPDLELLRSDGIDAVLVATALHDDRLSGLQWSG